MQRVLPINPLLYSQINAERNELIIYYGVTPLQVINLEDKNSLYINAVNLVLCGMKQSEVAVAFGFDRSWMVRLMQIYRELGYKGIINIKKGYPCKITPEIKDYVFERFDYYYKINGLRNFRDKIIDDVSNKYNEKISYETLRIVLKPHKEEIRDKKATIEDNGNIENTSLQNEEKSASDRDIEIRDNIDEESTNRYNRYSGLLLLNSFVNKIPLVENLTKNINDGIEKIKEITILLVYMFFLANTKIENYKELKHRELMEIIDVDNYKYPDDIRRVLRDSLVFEDLMNVNKLMFKFYIEAENHKEMWLFIDGHVLRYFGRKKTTKVYHQQSHCAVTGRVQYYLHSWDGKQLYFEINDSYNDFREMINKFIDELKKIIGKKHKKYLYIFDRGGYSYEEFNYLDDKEIQFVTWEKGDRTDYKKQNLEYIKVELLLKSNKIDEPKKKIIEVAVVNNNYKIVNPENRNEYIELKKIVIKNGKKHTAFLTNAEGRGIEELARAMVFRWRQEKGFEVEVKYWGLNDINSYKADDFSEEIINRLGYEKNGIKYVDSNEYKKYKKEIEKLNREIKKHQQELGKIVEKRKTLVNLKDSKKYQKTVTNIDNLRDKKKEIGVKINQCTQQVRKLNKLIANGIKRLDYTQKFFMDIIKTACVHIDHNIMKVLSQYYRNGRDIFKMIDVILGTGGYIEHQPDGSLTVSLCKLNTERENELLESFVEYINNENPSLIFNKSKRIFFKTI
ncbi:hypothetical protein ES705_10261 [subsurface metagenome]